jgi:hypothetical protein
VETKTAKAARLFRSGEFVDSLRIVKSFRHLGDHKVTIQRGWDAHTNPRFAKSLGRDPNQLIEAARAAMDDFLPS